MNTDKMDSMIMQLWIVVVPAVLLLMVLGKLLFVVVLIGVIGSYLMACAHVHAGEALAAAQIEAARLAAEEAAALLAAAEIEAARIAAEEASG